MEILKRFVASNGALVSKCDSGFIVTEKSEKGADYDAVLSDLTEDQRNAMNAYVEDVKIIHEEYVLKNLLDDCNDANRPVSVPRQGCATGTEICMVVYDRWLKAFEKVNKRW